LDWGWDWTDGTTPDNSSADTKGNVGAAMFLIGGASALASIPFFIKIHKKRNAARAIIYSDKSMSFSPQVIMPHTQSAGVSIIISLGK